MYLFPDKSKNTYPDEDNDEEGTFTTDPLFVVVEPMVEVEDPPLFTPVVEDDDPEVFGLLVTGGVVKFNCELVR